MSNQTNSFSSPLSNEIIKSIDELNLSIIQKHHVRILAHCLEIFKDIAKDDTSLFEQDDETDAIVMIGEIGGSMEIEAAEYAKDNVTKPIIGFIAGQTAPEGRRMGHAGAIVSGADESAAAKMKEMSKCGIHVVSSPAEIGQKVKEVLRA